MTGGGDPAELAHLLRTERAGMWVMVVLSVTNIVLGVWRPRPVRPRAD